MLLDQMEKRPMKSKHIRLFLAVALAAAAVSAFAGGTARVRVVNTLAETLTLGDGRTVKPGATVQVDVPANEKGEILGATYPRLRPGSLYTMRVTAPPRPLTPSAQEQSGVGDEAPTEPVQEEESPTEPLQDDEAIVPIPPEPENWQETVISGVDRMLLQAADAMAQGLSPEEAVQRIEPGDLAFLASVSRFDADNIRDARRFAADCLAAGYGRRTPGGEALWRARITVGYKYQEMLAGFGPGQDEIERRYSEGLHGGAVKSGSMLLFSGLTVSIQRTDSPDGVQDERKFGAFVSVNLGLGEPGLWNFVYEPAAMAPPAGEVASLPPAPPPRGAMEDSANSSGPDIDSWKEIEKALLDFRMKFSDDPVRAFAAFAGIPLEQAEERIRKMTCGMPDEYRGFFREFVRRSMPLPVPLDGEYAWIALYNPWFDGVLLFPIRRTGDTFQLLAAPVVVAGESIRQNTLESRIDENAFSDGSEPIAALLSRSRLVRDGLKAIADSDDRTDFGLFEDNIDDELRLHQWKAVLSRFASLSKELATVVLMEADERRSAAGYAQFLELLGDDSEEASFFAPADARTWRELPEKYRRSLWPARVVPCADGLLVFCQSPLVPETVATLAFHDDSEDVSLSFFDFELESAP